MDRPDFMSEKAWQEWLQEHAKPARGKRPKRNGGGEAADSGPRPFAPIEGENNGEVVLVNAADIEPEPVNWLWRNGLQFGVLNLLAGRSTSGKSTIALSWSATVTCGGEWPDGQTCKPGRAVYWSGEDGIKDTLLPRFLAAGGDRSNMSFIEGVRGGERKRPFDPAVDMPKLAKAIENSATCR